MERYANRGGDSAVIAYEITDDSIRVQFQGGKIYLYNSIRPGSRAVNEMKVLARQGMGLNSYINRTVRKNYYQSF